MLKNIYKIFKTKIGPLLLSFSLALTLYVYVSLTQVSNNHSQLDYFFNLFSKKTKVVSVPVDALYKSEDYFVEGIPKEIYVSLEGPESVIESPNLSKDLRAQLDLRDLGPGTHEVEFTMVNLNNSIKATFDNPDTNVKIFKKTNKKFKIEKKYDENKLVSEDKKVDRILFSSDTIEVSGKNESVDKIKKVVVDFDNIANISSNTSFFVPIFAYDENNEQVKDVILNPKNINVEILLKKNE